MNKKRGFFESHNPVLREEAYQKAGRDTLDNSFIQVRGERMTVQGAINKTFILAGIMLLTATIGFTYPSMFLIWGGAIAALVVVFIAASRPERSPTLAPLYAGLEGLFVGGISAYYSQFFDGIILQAVSLTVAVLFMMLFIYKSGIIKVTSKLRTGVVMATGAIALVYLASIVLSFFNIQVPYLHEASPIGIGISLVIIGVASLNLLLDFDNFEKGEQYGAPAYMEWFSGMGLLITLVWLYIEILRLVAIFSSSD